MREKYLILYNDGDWEVAESIQMLANTLGLSVYETQHILVLSDYPSSIEKIVLLQGKEWY